MGRRSVVLGVVMVLLVGSAVLAHHQRNGREKPASLEVVTYNTGDIRSPRPTLEDVADVVINSGVPDLLVVQEVAGRKAASRLSGMLGLPHFLYADYKGSKSGLAILSRMPITERRAFHFSSSRIGTILCGSIPAEGQDVSVCSVHLDRIRPIEKNGQGIEMSWGSALRFLKTELLEETVRSRAVDELIVWLEERKPGKIIIGGDFNTVPLSKAIRKMNQAFDDALWPSRHYLTGSYRKFPLPVSPRIDYIFHSPDMECSDAMIVRDSPGDHYPVRASFAPEEG